MSECGLTLTKNDFDKLSDDKKLNIIYENLLDMRQNVASYKFHTKITYSTLGFLIGVIGFLCQYIFNGK